MPDTSSPLRRSETREEWLARYKPREVGELEWGDGLRDFVVQMLHPWRGNDEKVRRTALALSRLAQWSRRLGKPLTAEAILDPANIETWSEIGNPARRSRAADRSCLRQLGRDVAVSVPWIPAPPSLPQTCLLYTSPSPRDRQKSRMPSSA